MELVYLWVEEYKNIKKQGFNFSPRFRCDYDEKENKLDIVDKEETGEFYPKNFFGDNINVAAIVGENGSGKSSLLLGITNDKILIKKGDNFFANNFRSDEYSFNEINREKDYEIVYIDYDLIKLHSVKDFWDYSLQNIYDKNLYRKTESASGWDSNFNIEKFREHFFNIITEQIDSFDLKIFFYNPLKIIFTDYLHSITSEEKFGHINKLIKEVEKSNFTKEKFLVFLYSNISMKVPPDVKNVDSISELLKIENDIIENAHYYKLDNTDKIYEFLEELNNHELLIEKFKSIYKKYKKAFLKLIEIGYLKIDFEDEVTRRYFDLSFGERKLFTEMLMIFDAIKKSDRNDILVVLDEPDLTLHPDWQKKYISEMIKLLSNFPEKKFHLIITSHSPFILSDLPKENIIFLEKGKQVYPFDDGKQTFGANIHTLLSDGFFMKDGLMGEFAKDKIQSIIKYHEEILVKELTKEENKKRREEEKEIYDKEYKIQFWQIQSIIGDDYLKQVIKNHLVEIEKIVLGNDEAKKEEIKRLKAQIELLEK